MTPTLDNFIAVATDQLGRRPALLGVRLGTNEFTAFGAELAARKLPALPQIMAHQDERRPLVFDITWPGTAGTDGRTLNIKVLVYRGRAANLFEVVTVDRRAECGMGSAEAGK